MFTITSYRKHGPISKRSVCVNITMQLVYLSTAKCLCYSLLIWGGGGGGRGGGAGLFTEKYCSPFSGMAMVALSSSSSVEAARRTWWRMDSSSGWSMITAGLPRPGSKTWMQQVVTKWDYAIDCNVLIFCRGQGKSTVLALSFNIYISSYPPPTVG